jgi:hypothetical protein
MPLPVLPQIIVEAGLLPDAPVQASTFLRLDDPSFGLLDTATLGTAIGWTDISQWVAAFTITRPSTRLQGPLWNYQASTASVLLDNSDGRFDPDNLAGPYIVGGSSQLIAMVPVRVRAVFAGVTYALYSGFADGWTPVQVTYEGGYAELALSATDAFKPLAGITLAPVATEGTGAATGARITDILTRAGWYASGDRRLISTGNSALQGTALGDTALNLMQIAADSEIGQLYVNGSGAVVFRARRDLLTDARSNTAQAVFGDLAPAQSSGFEVSLGNWAGGANCSVALSSSAARSGSQSMAMTSAAAGTMTAVSCLAGSIPSQGLPCSPGDMVNGSAWFQAATAGRSCLVQAAFYTSGGTLISTASGTVVTDVTTAFTQAVISAAAPATAAFARLITSVQGTGAGAEVHYADDVSIAVGELAYAAVTRASDDTTIANDIQATRLGGTLQEVQDAASVAKYLFPRTYARSDLILQTDADALNWAQWMLYISKGGEDRFESLQVDPQADPVNLWPQVLGRETGDRITIWQRPAGLASPVTKDCFIAGITHAWDSAASSWLTTWTLQDATKYGSFMTLDNPVLGQLDANALVF